MLKKPLIISASSLAVILLLLIPSGILIKELKDLNKFKPVINQYIAKNIHGSVELGNIAWTLQKGRLGFRTDSFSLKDEQANVLVQAENSFILFRWDSLFHGFTRFYKIKSEKLKLDLVKDEAGIWNLEKVLSKHPKKAQGFFIQKLNIPQLHIKVLDSKSGHFIEYPKFSAYWSKKKFKNSFQVSLRSDNTIDPGKIEESELAKQQNYLDIQGILSLAMFKDWKDYDTDLEFDFVNLDLDKFKALLSSFELSKEVSGLITGSGQLYKKKSQSLSADGNFSLKDFSWFWSKLSYDKILIPDASLDYDIWINKKDIGLKKFDLNFADILVAFEGRIKNWRKDLPSLDLGIKTNEFRFKKALAQAPKALIPLNIRGKVENIRDDGLISFDLKLSDNIFAPQVTGKLKFDQFTLTTIYSAVPVARDISVELDLQKDKILINKFVIPVAFSKIQINGWIDNERESLDIELKSQDLSLKRLRYLLLSSWIAEGQENLLSLFDLSGFINLDLEFLKKKNSELKVLGSSKFGKVDFLSLKYPLNLKNIYGDVKFQNKKLVIDKLFGFIAEDYFEALGSVFLGDNPFVDLRFASKEIDFEKLINSKALSALSFDPVPQSSKGKLKDVFLDVKGTVQDKNFDVIGKMDLDNVSFQETTETPVVSSMTGKLEFTKDSFKANSLQFLYGQAKLLLDGELIQKQGNLISKFRTRAEDLNFKYLIDLLNRFKTPKQLAFIEKITKPQGSIDCNITVSESGLDGDLSMHQIGFDFADNPIVFNQLSGDMNLNGTSLSFDNFKGNFGKSNLTLDGSVDKYLSKNIRDLIWDLDITGTINANEIMPRMHKKFRKYFDIKGLLPMSASVKGNKTKTTIDAEFSMNDLSHFQFSNWLVKDPAAKVNVKTKLIITPQLIVSDDAVISFGEEEVAEDIRAVYQVKDWPSKERTFYTSFETNKHNAQLVNFEPSIKILKPYNLDLETGNFICETYGDAFQSQTICDINIDQGIARQFGIGDAYANGVEVDLISTTGQPVRANYSFANGNWNGIPYEELEFDVESSQELSKITDVKAKVLKGEINADFEVANDQSSKFSFTGSNLPAHELAQGLWGLGLEIPEGLVDGTFEGTTKGLEPEPMFENLIGESNVIIKNGKLSSLKSMQKLLTALNTLERGLFGLDVNNIAQTLITYEGGQFDYLVSSVDYKNGLVSTDKTLLKADQIEIDANGVIDFLGDNLYVAGVGLIPKKSKSILGKIGIGKLNLGNAFSTFSGHEKDNRRFFKFEASGKVYDSTETVQSLRDNFSWL